MYIAHRTDEPVVRNQSLKTHLTNTKILCERYGADLGLKHVCGLAGWLHDAGKYSEKFQNYINQVHTETVGKQKINHAFAGARMLEHHFHFQQKNEYETIFAELIENVIMAHHNPGGPYDFIDPVGRKNQHHASGLNRLPFSEKMRETMTDWTVEEIEQRFFTDFEKSDFEAYLKLALKEIQQKNEDDLLDYQLYYLRFIASCLVDADHSDTAAFASDKDYRPLDTTKILRTYQAANEKATAKLANKVVANSQMRALNQVRQAMSEQSATSGKGPIGIYKLSVPTGGGKTFASLRFALNQALTHDFKRIIYIVPYTTIIEQNAAEIRKQLELDEDDYAHVLEYHSTLNEDGLNFNYYYAKDTWDAPVIMTTQVAYLNALYGRGSKNLRHMHRLISATLIFDEIQTLPAKTISMNNAFLKWLEKEKASTSLLCTATQPTLEAESLENHIPEATEIVQDLPTVEKQFQRVTIDTHFLKSAWEIEDLVDFAVQKLEEVNSVLVVLNTKAAVKAAYEGFKAQNEAVTAYHLSTYMCPAHRKDKFKIISKDLATARTGEKKVIVFSTRLIEAGVDLSFESAIRSLTGLDSVIQTAGRCNRNHETALAKTYLIKMSNSAENLGSGLEEIRITGDITTSIVEKYEDSELMSSRAIADFFERYYGKNQIDKTLDYPLPNDQSGEKTLYKFGHKERCGSVVNEDAARYVNEAVKDIPHIWLFAAPQTISENFRVIDSQTTSVIVPYNDKGNNIITTLLSDSASFEEISNALKEAQNYSIQIYGNLSNSNGFTKGISAVETFRGSLIYYANSGSYDDNVGFTNSLSLAMF
ncbi:CRISPR-associated helicase Cas3' [Agrilactobacillus yilanensis]|uniref:CRISPR-associated helicase Cas3 n=1 Tax=Agrilactobacillus yilanensis TaxID=2485997 RepID=A0ABW4J4S5_9LACO|nr:CRISPR-associated helicase Cas3' [Agrilactobacillus yilanensis]